MNSLLNYSHTPNVQEGSKAARQPGSHVGSYVEMGNCAGQHRTSYDGGESVNLFRAGYAMNTEFKLGHLWGCVLR